MPVEMRFNGSTIVYVPIDWPAECKLEPRKAEEMTPEELKAELALLVTHREEDLHKAACINPSCPAKR
jgi:hypothetical protein